MFGNNSNKYEFAAGEVFRSVASTVQGSTQFSIPQFNTATFGPSTLSLNSSFKNDKVASTVGPIPSLLPIYFLERTNFNSSLDSKVLTDFISKFLLKNDINFLFKPNKYKFKCSDFLANNFVIRLFRNDSGSITVEVQHRSGCSMRFRTIYHKLQNEFSSHPTPTQPKPFQAPEFFLAPSSFPTHHLSPSNETIDEELTAIHLGLLSLCVDTQDFAVGQLCTLLNSKSISNSDTTNSLLREIEKILHDMAVSYWGLHIFNSFHHVIMALNQLNECFKEFNETVDYNETVRILFEAITSTTQSTYICESVALFIHKLAYVCPKVLIQNEVLRKLQLANVRQSSRDTFKNKLANFQRQLQDIASIITLK